MAGLGQKAFGHIAPKLAEVTDQVLFGDIWERPGLSRRERSLVTIAALVAMVRLEQLPFHIARALENGWTRAELAEAVTHLAFYAGWPAAASAISLLDNA
jgi:4-carboxymuconolactone decarboxylase